MGELCLGRVTQYITMYKKNTYKWIKHIDFIILDTAVLFLSFVLAYLIRHEGSNPFAKTEYITLAVLICSADILISILFNTMHNVMKRGVYEEFVQSLKQVGAILFCEMVYIFFTATGDMSRLTILLTSVFHMILGYTTRIIWKKIAPKEKRRVLLITDSERLKEINNKEQFVGAVLTDGATKAEGINIVEKLENAAAYICREWIDEVFIYPSSIGDIENIVTDRSFFEDDFGEFRKKDYIVESKKAVTDVGQIIERCREMSVPVHVKLPGIGGKSFIEKINGTFVITTASKTASPLQIFLKRAMDIAGGIAGSIIAVFIIIAVSGKIKKASPGPVLFKQERIGKNGKRFKCYKIRTMHLNADQMKDKLKDQNKVNGLMFKMDWDPRVIGNVEVDGVQKTGIGEKLRRGSWDEWPQFFNVLMGQMSLVGTRPPTVDEWERYEFHHRARMSMKPGITGLWQVSGRSDITDFEEVVRLDTEYIDNWSIGLDVRILLKTFKVVKDKDGAA